MNVRLALDGTVATGPSCWRRREPAGVWDADRAYPYRDRQRSSGALSSAPAVSPALASTPLLSPAAALGGSSSSRHVCASSNQAVTAKIGTCHGKLAAESYDVLSR